MQPMVGSLFDCCTEHLPIVENDEAVKVSGAHFERALRQKRDEKVTVVSSAETTFTKQRATLA